MLLEEKEGLEARCQVREAYFLQSWDIESCLKKESYDIVKINQSSFFLGSGNQLWKHKARVAGNVFSFNSEFLLVVVMSIVHVQVTQEALAKFQSSQQVSTRTGSFSCNQDYLFIFLLLHSSRNWARRNTSLGVCGKGDLVEHADHRGLEQLLF